MLFRSGAVYLISLGMIFIYSLVLIEFKFNYSIILDIIFSFCLIYLCYFFWYNYGADIGPPCYWGFSFQYIILPFITLIVYSFIYYDEKIKLQPIKSLSNNESDEENTPQNP